MHGDTPSTSSQVHQPEHQNLKRRKITEVGLILLPTTTYTMLMWRIDRNRLSLTSGQSFVAAERAKQSPPEVFPRATRGGLCAYLWLSWIVWVVQRGWRTRAMSRLYRDRRIWSYIYYKNASINMKGPEERTLIIALISFTWIEY
jgi:hypothetical protein